MTDWDDYAALCAVECGETADPCPAGVCRSRLEHEHRPPPVVRKVVYAATFVERVRELTGDHRFPLRAAPSGADKRPHDGTIGPNRDGS